MISKRALVLINQFFIVKNCIIACCFFFSINTFAQTDTIHFTKISDFDFSFLYSAYTSEFDKQSRPYLYAACRELGVVIFDISNINDPHPVDTIPISVFSFLRPTNLIQVENDLFVSLGGYDGLFPQNPGMAILDISDPENAAIKDVWYDSDYSQGCAIVITDGTYAYLGAMDAGVIIVDVSDRENITFVSHILPDPDFPDEPELFTTPNARGLYKLNDETLLVANDHGGLRWIDISNIESPIETGKYINEDLYASAASAYNNIAVKDHYAYIPVDYCGLEIVDVSDSDMETVSWFNPWDCDFTNWIGRQGHTNEAKIFNDLLFVSGGDSEVLAFDISNPALPILVGQYAKVYDSIVAWSLDVNDTYISLALINNSVLGIPYYSNVGGIQILQWENILSTEHTQINPFSAFSNPFNDEIKILLPPFDKKLIVKIADVSGNIVFSKIFLNESEINADTKLLPPGIYFLLIYTEEAFYSVPLIKSQP